MIENSKCPYCNSYIEVSSNGGWHCSTCGNAQLSSIASRIYQQGWQCPICEAVMSPDQRVCVNCTGKTKII